MKKKASNTSIFYPVHNESYHISTVDTQPDCETLFLETSTLTPMVTNSSLTYSFFHSLAQRGLFFYKIWFKTNKGRMLQKFNPGRC